MGVYNSLQILPPLQINTIKLIEQYQRSKDTK